jgi:hypothetical protein
MGNNHLIFTAKAVFDDAMNHHCHQTHSSTTWLVVLVILLIVEDLNFLLFYGDILSEYTISLGLT